MVAKILAFAPTTGFLRPPGMRVLEGLGMALERDSGVRSALRGDFLALSATVVLVSSLSLRSVLVAFCGLRRITMSDFGSCSFATLISNSTGEAYLPSVGEVVVFGIFDLAGLLVTN